MNRTQMLGALLCLGALSGCSGAADTNADANDESIGATATALEAKDVSFDVTVRGTGKVSIHAQVYENAGVRAGANILAIHGLSETGFTYGPLSQAIFKDRVLGRGVKRVIAISMPGHDNSGFPTNLPSGTRFGDLAIEDNVSVVTQAIDALRRQGLAPRMIIGHSMGGLETQAAQQTLLAQGSSLAAHGVSGVVLLAPVPPHAQPWHPAQTGDLTPFVVSDPVLGNYLSTPPEVFIGLGFTTPTGQVGAGTPTPDQIIANHYTGPEPISTVLQLLESEVPLPTGGTLTLARPSVSAGAFGPRHGTLLTLVSFSQDILVPPPDLKDLYEYLTGDKRDLFYRPVSTPDAVHASYISDPSAVVDALRVMF